MALLPGGVAGAKEPLGALEDNRVLLVPADACASAERLGEALDARQPLVMVAPPARKTGDAPSFEIAVHVIVDDGCLDGLGSHRRSCFRAG